MLCLICNQKMNLQKVEIYDIFKCQTCCLYFCPEASNPTWYGAEYFLHYKLYAKTEFSLELNASRWNFITSNMSEFKTVLDYGCGADAFMKQKPKNVKFKDYSYDPVIVPDMQFLQEPFLDIVTFWDTFEHIRRLGIVPLLKAKHIFMSIPILKSTTQLESWKHFRPMEHVWCFSHQALKSFMKKIGYELKTVSDFETKLGREDIYSYYFKKI